MPVATVIDRGAGMRGWARAPAAAVAAVALACGVPTTPSGSAGGAASAPPRELADHGGRVLASTTTYAIWWGAPAVASEAQAVESLLAGLDGSPYLGLLDQYMRGTRTRSRFGGTLLDLSPPPPIAATSEGARAVVAEVCAMLDRGGASATSDTVYLVFPTMASWGGEAGGWHSFGDCHGTRIAVAALGSSAERVIAHELFEILTDPWLDAWSFEPRAEGPLEEIADECENEPLLPVMLTGGAVLLPKMYSRAVRGCAMQ